MNEGFIAEYTIELNPDVTEHMLGKHDQSTHANRFGTNDKGERVLVRRGGEKKASAKQPKSPPPQPLPRMPFSQQDFEQAKLTAFHGGINSVYSTMINGEKYFVKQADEAGSEPAEVVASQMAKDLGLDQYTVPCEMMARNGSTYLVAPWTNQKPFANFTRDEQAKVVQGLSEQDFTRMHAYEFLLNDGDRHSGNYLMDPATGSMKMIDTGYAFSTEFSFSPKTSAFDKARVPGDTKSIMSSPISYKVLALPLDKATIADVATRTSNFAQYMQTAGLPEHRIQAMQTRASALQRAASMPGDLTIGSLQTLYWGS